LRCSGQQTMRQSSHAQSTSHARRSGARLRALDDRGQRRLKRDADSGCPASVGYILGTSCRAGRPRTRSARCAMPVSCRSGRSAARGRPPAGERSGGECRQRACPPVAATADRGRNPGPWTEIRPGARAHTASSAGPAPVKRFALGPPGRPTGDRAPPPALNRQSRVAAAIPPTTTTRTSRLSGRPAQIRESGRKQRATPRGPGRPPRQYLCIRRDENGVTALMLLVVR
jgi:hypothetical protein